MRPARGAAGACSIFIASTTARRWPSSTVALGDGERDQAPVHRRPDLARPLPAPAVRPQEDRRTRRGLSPAGEDVAGPWRSSTDRPTAQARGGRQIQTRDGPASRRRPIARDDRRPGDRTRRGAAPPTRRNRRHSRDLGVARDRRRDQGRRAGKNGARVRRPRLGAKAGGVSVDEPRVDGAALDLARRAARRERRGWSWGRRLPPASAPRSAASAPSRLGAWAISLAISEFVKRRHVVACLEASVDAQRWRSLEPHREDATGTRQEALFRVFGVEPRFDRPAVAADFILPERQRLAGGDAKLPFDQIEAGDRLGDGVLDLQPCVHLEKIETARPRPARRIEQELEGAGADVADRARARDCRLAHRRSGRLRQAGGRALFDDLLMAALQRTIALEEMDDPAVAIAEHLNFDMARRERYFSSNTRGSPNACSASRAAASSAPSNSTCASTRRMPRPPPPAIALISTG